MTGLHLDLMTFPARFRMRFAHGSATRSETENVVCVARADGQTGHGEGCPRGYVTGEKLYETQAMEAARKVAQAIGIAPGFFIAVADPQAALYRLFHEIDAPPSPDRAAEAASLFDAALCARNIEYADKRSSGRLSPAEVVFVRPGAGEAVKAAAIAAGQREAQVKPPLLVDAAHWRFDFGPYRWDGDE